MTFKSVEVVVVVAVVLDIVGMVVVVDRVVVIVVVVIVVVAVVVLDVVVAVVQLFKIVTCTIFRVCTAANFCKSCWDASGFCGTVADFILTKITASTPAETINFSSQTLLEPPICSTVRIGFESRQVKKNLPGEVPCI